LKHPNNVKQILIYLKGEIDSITIIVGDFNTQFQQCTDPSDIKSTNSQVILHPGPNDRWVQNSLPTVTKYILLITHGTFTRIDHTICHKKTQSKFLKIKIPPSIFSDHDLIKLENINKKTLKTIPTHEN
jgi:hypothetical protein